VGPALTVRNIAQREHAYETARRHVNKMAEFEAHNLALPGDVIVIDGVAGISNMGGISAQTGKRQGEAGAIVFGGIRDIAHSRRVGYPVWSTEVTPVTGKWRIETVEINGDIEVAGVRVAPGDIVFADDTGVCFIPRARAAEVLGLARKKAAAEEAKCRAIDAGTAVADLPGNA
jgi:regulator of RNase E activity RraA